MTSITVPSQVDFSEQRDDLVTDALRLAGVLDITESPNAAVSTAAVRTLNVYLKYLMKNGLHLWRQTEGVLFLDSGTESYDLGTSGDHACQLDDFVATALNGAAASAATSLTVDSTSGMAVSDAIGIELTDGTRHWTTIATIPSTTTLTITSGLASAASDDGTVYTYTNLVERPTRIYNLRRRDSSGIEVPVFDASRAEYLAQSNKATSGKIVMGHYSPQLDNGTLYVWPTADDVTDQLRFTYDRTIHDVDTGTDTFDVPVEWLEPLTYGLALRLAHKYGKTDRIAYLKPEAEQKEAELLAFDTEESSVFVQPEYR